MKVSCSICLEDLTDNSTMVALPCGHVFDEVCIIECYQISQKCPICKRQHNGVQPYRRLYFSNSGESTSDADQVLIQSLKAKVDRLEANLKIKSSSQTSKDMFGQLDRLYSDYEEKDAELIEAVSKLSLVTAMNEMLEERNLSLKSNLLEAHNEKASVNADREFLKRQLRFTQYQLKSLTTRERNRSVSDIQNAALIQIEQHGTIQLAKAEEELATQRSRIADLEAKCKVLANNNVILQERQIAVAFPSSQRRPNVNHNRIYEQRILALEIELASTKTQRNRHHREATKQKKKVDNLEKQTEEMAQVIRVLDTLIEKGGLHILNQPSSSRNQGRADTRLEYQDWV